MEYWIGGVSILIGWGAASLWGLARSIETRIYRYVRYVPHEVTE